MDHESAIRMVAVERYQLGEMGAEERDAFEEHYFGCPMCAEAVRMSSALEQDLKAVLREPVAERRRGWWLRLPVMVPACAAMGLAMLVVYQNAVVLPALKAPRELGPAAILDGQTRGAAPKVPGGQGLRVEMGLDAVKVSRLRVEIETPAGGTVAAGVVPAPAPKQPLEIYFPGDFRAGRYLVVVSEAPEGREIARSPLQIGAE